MTKFKIGFIKSARDITSEKYESIYGVKPRIENRGDKKYLQISGDFYDLFKLYHEKKPWQTMVSSFDVPEEIPIWFNNDSLKKFYNVELLDALREEPYDLEKYLTRSYKSNTREIRAKDYAVIKGKVLNVFNVMSNVRDDTSEHPFETQKRYANICKTYRLPALTLFVTHN